MIVCSCLGITDGDIREATRSDSPFPAGTCCGSCLPLVSDIVQRLKEDEPVSAEGDANGTVSDSRDAR